MTAKIINYTDEQSARLVSGYQAGETVEALAAEMGKSIRSVIAKLSRSGVYEAKVYQTKQGEAVVKKDAHADAIGAILRLTEAETSSLAKANKAVLVKVFNALAMSKPI